MWRESRKARHQTRSDFIEAQARHTAALASDSYFHVSHPSNRDSIEQHGLLSDQDEGLWLFHDREKANRMAGATKDIWEVHPPRETVVVDGDQGFSHTSDNMPASSLKRLTSALASDSYPELEDILRDRPPLERMGVAQPETTGNTSICPLCGIRPVETTAQGSDVCGYCAKNKFGIPSDNTDPAEFGEYTAARDSVDESTVRHLATCPNCKKPHALDIPASAAKAFGGDMGNMGAWAPKHWAQHDADMASGRLDPMARYGMSTDDIKCRNCGTPILHWKPVNGRKSDKVMCSQRCMNSKRPDCECECVGKNHGMAHLGGLQKSAAQAGLFDWLLQKADEHGHLNPSGATPSFDWCRFRRNQHCFYPKDLDRNASAQAGYAVWIPEDRGPCPRQMWEDQKQCFSGDTEFLTYDGYRTFKEVVGTNQKVLTSTGQWVDADVRSFGTQSLMRVTLSRGRVTDSLVIYATPGHHWFIKGRKHTSRTERQDYRLPRVTSTLKPGDKLASVLPYPYLGRWQPSPIGVMHGFVFGDGYREGNPTRLRGNGCSVTLWGDKDLVLTNYFDGHQQHLEKTTENGVQGITISGLPGFFKDRPSLDECAEYLYGWLVGYFAADGNVSDGIQLDCVDRETLEFVQAICNRLTIATYGIRSKIRQGCYGSGIIHDSNMRRNGVCSLEQPQEIFSLGFVGQTLRPEFFLIDSHREKFLARKDVSPKLAWTVVSVEPTDRIEEVFCAVVPVTESFVLVDNILTGNCPISEPGPRSRDPHALTDATVPWNQGGQRGGHSNEEPMTLPGHWSALDKESEYLTLDYVKELGRQALAEDPDYLYRGQDGPPKLATADPDFRFEFTASWSDVRAKATKLRKEGHVRIISTPSQSNPYITAEVMGDTNAYQTTLLRSLGGKSVAGWECGCAWAHYSWGRSGRWAKYEGRMCSHALATLYQAQAEEMFGGKVKEVERKPAWQDSQTHIVQPGEYKDKAREIGPWRIGVLGAADPAYSNQVAHMDDWSEGTHPDDGPRTGTFGLRDNPEAPGSVHVHKVESWPNSYYLRNLSVPSEHRNRGHGTRLMNEVMDEHDKNGSTLVLDTAQPHLQAWYHDMGFQPHGEKDDFFGQRMVRHPKKHQAPATGIWYGGGNSGETGEDEGSGPEDEGSGSGDSDSGGGTTAGFHTFSIEASLARPPITLEASMALEAGESAAEVMEYLTSLGVAQPLVVMAQALVDPTVVKDPRGVKHTIIEFGHDDLYTDAGEALDPETVVHPMFDWESGLDFPHDSKQNDSRSVSDIDCAITFHTHQVHDMNKVLEHEAMLRLAAGADTNGVMIALVPPRYVLNSLNVEGGEPVDQMHITVAYLGKTDGIDEHELHKAVAAFATTAPQMHARITGFGQFNKGVHVALVDIPGIDQFRRHLMTFLAGADISVTDEHGVQPHITLAYTDEDMKLEDHDADHEFELEWVTVAYGGEWTQYPLQGKQDFAKAASMKTIALDYDDGGISTEARSPRSRTISPSFHPEGVNTGFEDLPKSHQDQLHQHVHDRSPDSSSPLTQRDGKGEWNHEPMVQNIMAHVRRAKEETPEMHKAGTTWYKDAHKMTKGWAETHGISHESAAAATAAMSPNCSWENNVTGSHYLIRHIGPNNHMDHEGDGLDHTRLRMAPGHAEGNFGERRTKVQREAAGMASKAYAGVKHLEGKAFHEMSDDDAAKAVRYQAQYTDRVHDEIGEPTAGSANTDKPVRAKTAFTYQNNMARAVSAVRGKTPAQALGGHKVRSFYNNIIDPDNKEGKSSVTIDSHAISAAANAKYSGGAMKRIFESGGKGASAREKSYGQHGTYSLFQHAYKEAHRRLVSEGSMPEGSHPHDTQAVTWNEWRRQMGGGRSRSKATNPYPVIGEDGRISRQSAWIPIWMTSVFDWTSGIPKTINPWDSPEGYEDEPDPDVFPEENEEYHERRKDQKKQGALRTASITVLSYDPWDIFIVSAIEGDSAQRSTTLDEDEEYPHGANVEDEYWNRNREPEVTHHQIPSYMGPTMGTLHEARPGDSPYSQTGMWADQTAGEGRRNKPKLLKALPHSKCECDSCMSVREQNHAAREMMNWRRPEYKGTGNYISPEEEHYRQMEMQGSLDPDDEFAFEGELHDPATPALPETTSAEPENERPPSNIWNLDHATDAPNPGSAGPADFGRPLDPNSYHEDMGIREMDESLLAPGAAPTNPVGQTQDWSEGLDAMASLQPGDDPDLAAGRSWLMSGGGSPSSNGNNPAAASDGDIAAMAKRVLTEGTGVLKEGAKKFTPSEQHALIHEGGGTTKARNFGSLDIKGTHYEQIDAALANDEEDDSWLGL